MCCATSQGSVSVTHQDQVDQRAHVALAVNTGGIVGAITERELERRVVFDDNRADIETLAKTEWITWLDDADKAPESATALVSDIRILIPLTGLIDKDAKLARLEKEIGKLQVSIDKGEA